MHKKIGLLIVFFVIIPISLSMTIDEFDSGSVFSHAFDPPGSESTSFTITESNQCLDSATVTVSGVEITSTTGSADVVLITDRSTSMKWEFDDDWNDGVERGCNHPNLFDLDTEKLSVAKCVEISFVNNFLDPLYPLKRIGLVSYSDNANIDRYFTTNNNQLTSEIDSYSASGSTNIAEAIVDGIDLIESDALASTPNTIILMTDGNATECYDPGLCTRAIAAEQARKYAYIDDTFSAKAKGIPIFTVGFGVDDNIDEALLQDIATETGGKYYHGSDPGKLADIYDEIEDEIVTVSSPTPEIDVDEGAAIDFATAAPLTGSITWTDDCPGASCYSFEDLIQENLDTCNSPPCSVNWDISTSTAGEIVLEDLEIISSTCQVCGNGIPQPPVEECDDGNNDNNDGCDANCFIEECGDGITHTGIGETCDDGNTVSNDGCSSSCILEECGDGITQDGIGEECDDWNTDDNDGCDSNCIIEFCGDGITQDGIGESCDDGNNLDNDGCDSSCKSEGCGDGITQSGIGETCDDGNTVSNDGCSAACITEECGDGITQDGIGEECDDGANLDNDGCDSNCIIEFCGDGTTHSGIGEECDDGGNVDNDGCDANCIIEFCGDGTAQDGIGEECDDGGNVDNDGCNAMCVLEVCGDGITQDGIGETCDDGNTLDNDGCSDLCVLETCGDGTIQPGLGEDCDDGNNLDNDTCDAACFDEYCGDGVLQQGSYYEECEDGNTNNNDGCSATCSIETILLIEDTSISFDYDTHFPGGYDYLLENMLSPIAILPCTADSLQWSLGSYNNFIITGPVDPDGDIDIIPSDTDWTDSTSESIQVDVSCVESANTYTSSAILIIDYTFNGGFTGDIGCRGSIPRYVIHKDESLLVDLSEIFTFPPVTGNIDYLDEDSSSDLDVTPDPAGDYDQIIVESTRLVGRERFNIQIRTDIGHISDTCPIEFFRLDSNCESLNCDPCFTNPNPYGCLDSSGCLDSEIKVYNPFVIALPSDLISQVIGISYSISDFDTLDSNFDVTPNNGGSSTIFQIDGTSALHNDRTAGVILFDFTGYENGPSRVCPDLHRIDYDVGSTVIDPNSVYTITKSKTVVGYYEQGGFILDNGPYIYTARVWLRE